MQPSCSPAALFTSGLKCIATYKMVTDAKLITWIQTHSFLVQVSIPLAKPGIRCKHQIQTEAETLNRLCTLISRHRLINMSTLWSLWYCTANSPPSILSNVPCLRANKLLFAESIFTRDGTFVCFALPFNSHHPTALTTAFSIMRLHLLFLHEIILVIFCTWLIIYLCVICVIIFVYNMKTESTFSSCH